MINNLLKLSLSMYLLGLVLLILLLIGLVFYILSRRKKANKSTKSAYSTNLGEIDYLQELVLTISNRKSLLSSKKLERLIVFYTFLTITIIFVSRRIDTIGVMEFIEVIGIWLGYGGYNSFMNYRDRKMENNQDPPVI